LLGGTKTCRQGLESGYARGSYSDDIHSMTDEWIVALGG